MLETFFPEKKMRLGCLVLSCLIYIEPERLRAWGEVAAWASIRATGWADAPRWGGRLRCWLATPLPLPQQWTCSAVQIVTRGPLSLYLGPRLVNVVSLAYKILTANHVLIMQPKGRTTDECSIRKVSVFILAPAVRPSAPENRGGGGRGGGVFGIRYWPGCWRPCHRMLLHAISADTYLIMSIRCSMGTRRLDLRLQPPWSRPGGEGLVPCRYRPIHQTIGREGALCALALG
jgi:hypothetical protein